MTQIMWLTDASLLEELTNATDNQRFFCVSGGSIPVAMSFL